MPAWGTVRALRGHLCLGDGWRWMREGRGGQPRGLGVCAGGPVGLRVCLEGSGALREAKVPALPWKLGASSVVWPVPGFSQTTFWRRTWVTLIKSPVERQHSFPEIS